MATYVPPKESEKEFELIPAGPHLARAISFIDLGSQETVHGLKRKLYISFEVPKKKEGDLPFIVGGFYGFSYHKKSNLHKMLKIIIPEFNPQNFNPKKDFLENIYNIIVSHNESGEKTYANIDVVTPVSEGQNLSKQITPSSFFFMGWEETGYSLSQEELDYLNSFPDFMQKMIKSSPEYKKCIGDKNADVAEEVFSEKKTENKE